MEFEEIDLDSCLPVVPSAVFTAAEHAACQRKAQPRLTWHEDSYSHDNAAAKDKSHETVFAVQSSGNVSSVCSSGVHRRQSHSDRYASSMDVADSLADSIEFSEWESSANLAANRSQMDAGQPGQERSVVLSIRIGDEKERQTKVAVQVLNPDSLIEPCKRLPGNESASNGMASLRAPATVHTIRRQQVGVMGSCLGHRLRCA